ncbi:hypothetical protein Tco_0098228 [Tanacetum coccineum]
MEVRSKFDEFSENKESVEEVVASGGEALGVDEDETNRVISVLKNGGGKFNDNIDEINLGLREECVIRVLEDRDVTGEKSRQVFSITPWVAKSRRRVLCYVQGSRRRKMKKSIGCSVDITTRNFHQCCVTKPLLSLDILLPSIRFPYTVKVTEHLMARSGTDLKMAKLVMSSPNHPTSEIEDAFSSNFSDYIPASPDYVPASPGKTYSSSLNNSFGVVPIVSPTLSLFHDDPYMKVMHAYYAKETPIPPPTIVPLSSMLSPMFNPQEFFFLEELLPPKKQGHNQSFSSTSCNTPKITTTQRNTTWGATS